MSFWLAAAALAAQGQGAGGVQWEWTAEEGGLTTYLDPASVRRTGEAVRFRMRGVLGAPRPDGSVAAVIDAEFDCAARTGTLYSTRSYNAQGGKIETIEIEADNRSAVPLSASSIDQPLYTRLCGRPLPARPPTPAPAQ